ncbi:hypothetical protein EYF80_019128 [Liparis tanakae]|uniref:Uncharacterized protein n=1 Tax=Liparis tanakae TaxID=230148 RepID=A0A4Z2HYP9_9TELE|nr:hypothetical protein EYF80_019128 [Liparis tanakae]
MRGRQIATLCDAPQLLVLMSKAPFSNTQQANSLLSAPVEKPIGWNAEPSGLKADGKQRKFSCSGTEGSVVYWGRGKVPRQLSALTLYRYEQSVLHYCHAHLSLQLNVGMEPPTQALGAPRPAEYRAGTSAPLPSEPVLPGPQTHSHLH